MVVFAGMSGKMMLMHQTKGNLMQMMHETCGYCAITIGIVRFVCIFWKEWAVVFGGLLTTVGVLLHFSSKAPTGGWENHPVFKELPHSWNMYLMLVLAVALWICIATLTVRYYVQRSKRISDGKEELQYELVSLKEDEGTESVTMEMDEGTESEMKS